MGKSGYLPDISYNFGFFRTLAVNSLHGKDYPGAVASLYTLNSCLGHDYMITINTKQFNESMRNLDAFICNHCTMVIDKVVNKGEEEEHIKQVEVQREIVLSEVNIFDVEVSEVEQILCQSKTIKVWICPYCQTSNDLSQTKKIQNERVQPFFLKVVASPPEPNAYMINRLGYPERLAVWFYNFLEEITWQEYLYRTEYQNQHGTDMEFDYKEKP